MRHRPTIYTITPNPALDIEGTVDRLTPNEKNYLSNETRSAGGNGINAARIANELGARVVASGFLGGSTGKEMEALLERERIPHQFIAAKGNTRFNLTVSNRSDHSQTRLSFPGPKIAPSEIRSLLEYANGIKLF